MGKELAPAPVSRHQQLHLSYKIIGTSGTHAIAKQQSAAGPMQFCTACCFCARRAMLSLSSLPGPWLTHCFRIRCYLSRAAYPCVPIAPSVIQRIWHGSNDVDV